MTDVNFSGNRPPEVVLPSEDAALLEALSRVQDGEVARPALAELVARHPRSLFGWAAYGRVARDDLEAYMAFRVGYHRGLDSLRQNGWRGSGYVRWNELTNRGFLRCLLGLARQAEAIGESEESQRCRVLLSQLDPTAAWDDID